MKYLFKNPLPPKLRWYLGVSPLPPPAFYYNTKGVIVNV